MGYEIRTGNTGDLYFIGDDRSGLAHTLTLGQVRVLAHAHARGTIRSAEVAGILWGMPAAQWRKKASRGRERTIDRSPTRKPIANTAPARDLGVDRTWPGAGSVEPHRRGPGSANLADDRLAVVGLV